MAWRSKLVQQWWWKSICQPLVLPLIEVGRISLPWKPWTNVLSLRNKRFKSATEWSFKTVSVLKSFFKRNLFVYKFKPIVINKFVAPSPQNEMLLANHKIVIRKYNLERKNAGESSPFTRDSLGGGPNFLLNCNSSYYPLFSLLEFASSMNAFWQAQNCHFF